ncbi:MAG: 2-hydroxy-3-keto-5-methylthiopentenyl-phosphate phosphatase [Fusobacteriaceae bacterium]|nr:HAD-superfamily hydrolase subfamily hypothetical 1 [Fusobacteriales bacterium]MDN5304193.1 2-hydroxy-3-keto-5-methylthiopentenyl-phosphate phosphatase [Fusobacteriaceae bacterium]
MKEKIFLVDFDKTITLNDSTDELLKQYNKELVYEYQRKFKEGKLRVRDYIKGLVESLDIDEEEYKKNVVKNVEIDPYFKDFLDYINYNIRVVSAGAYENILPNFEKNKIDIPIEHIYSNKVNFTNDGIKVTFPHDVNEAFEGICKRSIVEKYKKEYEKVIFIGDGSSDILCVSSADYVFAKIGHNLEKYCDENNIKHFKYNNFKDIIEILKKERI